MDKRILIYMPALNEAATIKQVVRSMPTSLEGISEIRVLVVDDGSRDETAALAREAGAAVVSHGYNRGVGCAFHTAMDQALMRGVDILVSTDADGQFNPADISHLLAPILRGEAEVVTGNRFATGKRPENMSRIKYWGNCWMAWLISYLAKTSIRDAACGFRAYSREALLNLNLFGHFTYTQETLLNLCYKGVKVVEVPVQVTYFQKRRSRVAGNVIGYAFKTLNIILKSVRDYQPLKFFGYGGIAIFLLGLAIDILVFAHYLRTGMFNPYKAFGFLGGLLNLLGALTILLGVLAEMMNRNRLLQEKVLYFQRKAAYEGHLKTGSVSEANS